jgi:hypothetical protein
MTAIKKQRRASAFSRLVALAKQEYDYPNTSRAYLNATFQATCASIANIAASLHDARQNSAEDEPELVELNRLISSEGGHIHRGAALPLLARVAKRASDLDALERRVHRANQKLKRLQSEAWVLYQTSLNGLKTQESKLDALLTRLEQTQRYNEKQEARAQALLQLADTIEKLALCRVQLTTGFQALAMKDLLAEGYGPTSQLAARRVAMTILARWAKARTIEPWNDLFETHYNVVRARFTDTEGKGVKPVAKPKANEYFGAGAIETLLDAAAGTTRDRDAFLILANQVGRAVQVLQQDGRYRAAMQISWLNAALAVDNLEPVSVVEGDRDQFDLLHCVIKKQEFIESGPLVSVLVPAYNSQAWLPTAINSLLNQTWRNLEILIVDDQSTDNTFEVAKEFEAKHPRVKVLQNEVNAGPYVARNLALSNSSGVFVTVHDADDWSHPRKIERQVSALIKRPDVMANTSQTVRVNPSNFQILTRAGKALRLNYSSLMFRRAEVAAALGFWDPVRFGADSEFISRIEAFFGEGSIDYLDSGLLSLVRSVETSLTSGGGEDRLKGARRLYKRLFTQWHASCAVDPGALRLDPLAARKFQAPRKSLGLEEPTEAMPLVFIADLSEVAEQYLLQALEDKQLLAPGSGYVHVANPHFPIEVESKELVRRAILQNLNSVRLLGDEYGRKVRLRSSQTIITAASLVEKYNLMTPFESKVIQVLFESESEVAQLSQILKNCVNTLGSQPTTLLAKNDRVKEALNAAQAAGWDVRLF